MSALYCCCKQMRLGYLKQLNFSGNITDTTVLTGFFSCYAICVEFREMELLPLGTVAVT